MTFSKSGWYGAHAMVHLEQHYNENLIEFLIRQNIENNSACDRDRPYMCI